jgi:hypothetical protein
MAGPSDLPPDQAPFGELIVQGGRLNGARLALSSPLTAIGSGPGCDVKLNAPGIAPLHAAILQGPGGPVFRDLTEEGCQVNGQPTRTCPLAGGEVLSIGPFRLRVSLPPPATDEVSQESSESAVRAQEALRAQAAAVAAHQVGLLEQEERAASREAALARQESQLAAHLLERQRELEESRQAVRSESATARAELEGARAQVAAERAALQQEREAVRKDAQAAASERKRLAQLRHRLAQRYRSRAEQAQREAKSREERAEAARLRYEGELAQLQAWYEKANGEIELEKRRLREGWNELALDHQRWDEALNAEKAERARVAQEQAEHAAALLAAREALSADQQRWELARSATEEEARGLEARILSQRQVLARLERQADSLRQAQTLPTEPIPQESPPSGPPRDAWPERVRQVAAWLGDQRVCLLEHWEAYLAFQRKWEEDRASAQADLEALAQSLEDREKALAQAERSLASRQADLSRKLQALESRRTALEGLQSRLALQESAWRSEREARIEELKAAEEMAAARLRLYEEVHRRRCAVRAAEVTRLREALARAEDARRRWCQAWAEAARMSEGLEARERALIAAEAALEVARQQWALENVNPSRAEEQLEGLIRKARARLEPASRALEAARGVLEDGRARLDAQAATLLQLESALEERIRRQASESEAWESARRAAELESSRREAEAAQARARHALEHRELRELRDELERLARSLIESAPEAASASSAAA